MPPRVSFTIKTWRGTEVHKECVESVVNALNEGVKGDTVPMAQDLAPVDTGYLRSEIKVVKEATVQDPSIVWGGMAPYTVWQEIGSQGRPGRYFLRQAADRTYERIRGRVRRIK